MALVDALLDKITNESLRKALREQVVQLLSKHSFGLVFQQHKPESVELHNYRVSRNCKVRIKSEEGDDLYLVQGVKKGMATIRSLVDEPEYWDIGVDDLVVVREFGDPIYPGLVSTGRVERGGDKRPHLVLEAENFHALELLLYTHEGKIDAIYIDPPYNTRDKDWKYNNDYVDKADVYRHSKWLAMMERRLALAKRLLNQERSVLIVTIDDNEVNRLGLLLEKVFPASDLQIVSSVINPRGQYRDGGFSRCDEYLFFVTIGTAEVAGEPDENFSEGAFVPWRTLRRSDLSSARGTAKGGPHQFYPIYVNNKTGRIEGAGKSLPAKVDRQSAPKRRGCTSVFPVRDNGQEMNWGVGPTRFQQLLSKGYIRVGAHTPTKPQPFEISYLTSGRVADIETGRGQVVGEASDGSVIAQYVTHKLRMPLSNWTRPSHNAETGGTNVLKALLGEKTSFPYPKSIYAVEDALRYFIGDLPNAIVLDFFAGSGTTAHSVARLNRQDGGHRQCILVTNNEVSAAETAALIDEGHLPGQPEWERHGIYESITIPRIMAAFTGMRPDGKPVEGAYSYIDDRPMADGFEESAEFLTLTYEDPDLVSLGRRFEALAPLLWVKAGARGAIIEKAVEGWTLPADATYGVLFDADKWREFVDAVVARTSAVRHVFVVTDSDAVFQQILSELPAGVRGTRLYDDFLRAFELNTKGRA